MVPVNSDLFHDACPGTHKYLEIHYACLSTSAPTSNNQKPNSRTPWKPSWMSHRPKEHHNIGSNNGGPNSASEANNNSPSVNTIINVNKNLDKNNNNQSDTNSIRKPILVTEKVVVTDRVPITTPRPTTEAPTTTATSTTTASTMKARSSTTPRGPLVNEVVEPKTPIGGYPDPCKSRSFFQYLGKVLYIFSIRKALLGFFQESLRSCKNFQICTHRM